MDPHRTCLHPLRVCGLNHYYDGFFIIAPRIGGAFISQAKAIKHCSAVFLPAAKLRLCVLVPRSSIDTRQCGPVF